MHVASKRYKDESSRESRGPKIGPLLHDGIRERIPSVGLEGGDGLFSFREIPLDEQALDCRLEILNILRDGHTRNIIIRSFHFVCPCVSFDLVNAGCALGRPF